MTHLTRVRAAWTEQRQRLAYLSLAVALLLASHVPASAAGQAASLSQDLQDHLAAGHQSIDVLIQSDHATVDAIAARYGATVKRYLTSGAVVTMTAGQLAALQQDGTFDHLSGDFPIKSTSTDTLAASVNDVAIGADQVWAGLEGVRGLTGRGVGVAVIDSGVFTGHAALANKVLVSVDFTGTGETTDRFGHGTHVAGTIAAVPPANPAAPDTEQYRGVAWGAQIINLRVLDDTGSGQASSVIEAIDWAIAHRAQFNIRVINMSLGGPVYQSFRDDPLCQAAERAVAAGIVVVAAAGNFGETKDGTPIMGGTIVPANDPYVIAAGAVDTHQTPQRSDDTVAPYSSHGPTMFDLVVKPDLGGAGNRHRVGRGPGLVSHR